MSARPAAAAVVGRGLVDPTAPLVAADDEGFARGRAAFETLRVYDGRPFRLPEHLDRLVASARMLDLPEPDRAAVRTAAEEALAEAGLIDAVLRLYWTPGPGRGPTGIALVSAIPEWIEGARARGQRLVSLAYPRRAAPWLLPGTKSVSYATTSRPRPRRSGGCGRRAPGRPRRNRPRRAVTNVWWREGRTLLTPSLELGILAGETRAALLALAGTRATRSRPARTRCSVCWTRTRCSPPPRFAR